MKNKFRYWRVALRVTLGALFLAASYYKIVSPGAFAHEIYNYKLVPLWAVNPLAMLLPWVQFFCGAALIVNRGVKGASLLIVLMMASFQAALASALVRGLNIACGCFKSGGAAATWRTFARDSALFALALLNLRHSRESGNPGFPHFSKAGLRTGFPLPRE